MKSKISLIMIITLWLNHDSFAQLNVNFTVNTTIGRAPISPLIYGTNQVLSPTDKYQSIRMGGNRITSLNWENNASNAGSDYLHQSDSYMCGSLSTSDCNLPGKVYSAFYNDAKSRGIPYALATLQMAGYVAADKNGIVTEAETAPSSRWKQVVFKKNAAFTLSPNTADNFVYMDELVNYLKTNHGAASAGGIKGYFLDNEPALWPSTHARLHPNKPTAVELWTKSRDLSIALKNVDASAETFGGVFYGFGAYLNLQDAPDWSTEKGSYEWYLDYFLAKLKSASDSNGKRLLDVIDLHWYPEAIGDNRITFSGGNTTNDKAARIQAPRTLWDSEYVENSWIATNFRNFLPLIPKVQNSINTYYPNTKLSFSEYCYGGCNDYSGGIAQADVLGIFGKYGVYNGNWWNVCGSETSFVSAGFKIFTNYNGSGAAFGNTKVNSTMSDKVNTSIYASIEGNSENNLHVVVINKSNQAVNGIFNLTSGATYSVGNVWAFDQNNAAITARTSINSINGNSFNYTLPAYSVCHMVLSAGVEVASTRVIVRARSINPGSNMRIEIMDAATSTATTVLQSKAFDNLSTSFTNYTYTFTGVIPANRIRVRFLNNGGTPNRDLEVDYIQVNDVTFQSESSKTYSFGSVSGCGKGGYYQTQLLTCNGFFHYDIGTATNPPVTIYSDALAADWLDWSWSVVNNFSATPAKTGASALGSTFTEGWGGVSLRKGTAQNTSGYNAIKFWIHGGTGANKSLLFTSQTEDAAGTSTSSAFTATAGVWNEITIPLSALGNPTSIKRITFQNNSASAQSIIYFDDIRLVSTTATSVASNTSSTQKAVSIFPNPLKENVLHLSEQFTTSETVVEVRLQNLAGKEFLRKQLTKGESDVIIDTPLPNGIYNITIKMGETVYVQKLMIEN